MEERFEVTNTAIERNPFWIPDISILWHPETDHYTFVSEFLERLNRRHSLSPEERKRIPKTIQQLANLVNYPLTALEISMSATEEQVSEIFVRINSRGRTLNQSDFILTLMSVFWDEGRKLDAPVLYSKMKVRDLLNPTLQARKRALERHHLFPRRYLEQAGIQNRRDINQVANFALVEWYDNIDISDQPPEAYAPKYERHFTPDQLAVMYHYHALPEKWYEMGYFDFLEERRKRMVAIIREGFAKL